MGVGGGGLSRRAVLLAPRTPLAGIRLRPDMWTTYAAFAAIPALVRDGRVQRSQLSFLLATLTAPVTVQIVDNTDEVYATGTMRDPWATAAGTVLTLGNVDDAGLVVLRSGLPNPFWRLQFVGANGAQVSGSFGLAGSDSEFVWGLPTFDDGQVATFALSKISASSQSNIPSPETPTDEQGRVYVFCNSVIAGADA